MSHKGYGKPSKKKLNEKAEAARNRTGGKPSSETEHPVMETHPGARVPDPETGEKPAPVKKPRAKKTKPVEEPETVVNVSSGDDVGSSEGS